MRTDQHPLADDTVYGLEVAVYLVRLTVCFVRGHRYRGYRCRRCGNLTPAALERRDATRRVMRRITDRVADAIDKLAVNLSVLDQVNKIVAEKLEKLEWVVTSAKRDKQPAPSRHYRGDHETALNRCHDVRGASDEPR